MKTFIRSIIIGAIIWVVGVSVYSISFYIPMLENPEWQANLVLTLAVLPLVWLGAKTYYQKANSVNGMLLGLTFFLTAAFLDAVLTVPYLIIPNGGSYKQFYSDLGFWLIGFEFIMITSLYWYLNISKKYKIKSFIFSKSGN